MQGIPKVIYLAGGCFWGVEGYFGLVNGIVDTEAGYANGKTTETSSETAEQTDHAETVKIVYNSGLIGLREILLHYFRIIDPISINKQGDNIGRLYRTGIYYTDEDNALFIREFIAEQQKRFDEPIAVEVSMLRNFVPAEERHQDYLKKHPLEPCHINISLAAKPVYNEKAYTVPHKRQLEQQLTDIQYHVTQEKGTEQPYSSEYDTLFEKGIYTDIVTGRALFSSRDKFNADCGWPSFSKPITSRAVSFYQDSSEGMQRTEVIAAFGGTHLGHVFNDGRPDNSGLRYCINGAALRFIPLADMEKEGYADYIPEVE